MTRGLTINSRGVNTIDRSVYVGAVSAIPDSGNLHADWDASSFDSAFNDGDTITNDWSEAGGRTPDATVNGGPTYRTNVKNGEPAVDFDGTDDYFDTSLNVNTDKSRAVYGVIQFDTSDKQTVYGIFDGTNRFYTLNSSSSGQYQSGYADSYNAGGSSTTGSFIINTYNFASGSGEVWENNNSQVTLSYSSTGTLTDTIRIGERSDGNNTADAKVLRILDYQADHNSTTRQNVWNYLNNIYSVF